MESLKSFENVSKFNKQGAIIRWYSRVTVCQCCFICLIKFLLLTSSGYVRLIYNHSGTPSLGGAHYLSRQGIVSNLGRKCCWINNLGFVTSKIDKNSLFGVQKSDVRKNCPNWCNSMQWPIQKCCSAFVVESWPKINNKKKGLKSARLGSPWP